MKKLEKEKILKRRKEIEQVIKEFLSYTDSGFNLEDVKKIIYEEKDHNDLMGIIKKFNDKKFKDDFEKIITMFNDAWNYFPHKSLEGFSPAEKIKEYYKSVENDSKNFMLGSKKLTQKQIDLLWSGGEKGIYSQAKLIREIRILDKKVSREFLVVEVEINPTTFELVRKHRNDIEFKNDVAIQQLLDHADYRGPEFGYVSLAFQNEYRDEKVFKDADFVLRKVQDTIIKMHKFIMERYLK